MTFTEITRCCDQIRHRFTFDWLTDFDGPDSPPIDDWDWPPRP